MRDNEILLSAPITYGFDLKNKIPKNIGFGFFFNPMIQNKCLPCLLNPETWLLRWECAEKCGHFQSCYCMWCWLLVPTCPALQGKLSVTNQSHAAHRVVTACHYTQGFFPSDLRLKRFRNDHNLFPPVTREASGFVLSRFREKKTFCFWFVLRS